MKLSRLRVAVLATCLIALGTLDARANGKPADPTPVLTPSTSLSGAAAGAAAGVDADLSAGAAAGADSSSASKAKQGQAQQQGLNNNTSNASKYNALAIALPVPAYTPPMAPVTCPVGVEITQSSRAALWNGFSKADSHTDNADCVVIELTNSLIQQCQFYTAKLVQNEHLKKKLPNLKVPDIDQTKWIDLTPSECASSKRLAALPPVQQPPVTYNLILPPTPEKKVVAPPKTKKRAVVPPCGAGEVRACTKKSEPIR